MPRPHLCCIKGLSRTHTDTSGQGSTYTYTYTRTNARPHAMSWLPSLLLLVALQVSDGVAQDMEQELELARNASSSTITTQTTTSAGPSGGSTSPPPDKCEPDCSLATNDNPRVPDPLDCHKLYICFDGTPNGPLDCPDDEYFDTSKRDCVPNGAEECEAICSPGTGGVCSYRCDADTKYLVDRFDCSSYYDCTDITTVITCDNENPFFDGKECQTDESRCCHCKPYCYSGDGGHNVIDPLDCTKYYFCMKDNEVPEYPGSCRDGNFDPFRGTCSTTAPCIILCTNVVNPQGCIDVFTCQEQGYFAACPNKCDPRYYHCTSGDIGSTIMAVSCPDGDVFIEDTTQCINAAECPYELPAF